MGRISSDWRERSNIGIVSSDLLLPSVKDLWWASHLSRIVLLSISAPPDLSCHSEIHQRNTLDEICVKSRPSLFFILLRELPYYFFRSFSSHTRSFSWAFASPCGLCWCMTPAWLEEYLPIPVYVLIISCDGSLTKSRFLLHPSPLPDSIVLILLHSFLKGFYVFTSFIT